MAVQKSKKSKSKRGHRRSHNYLRLPVLFFDKNINEYVLYHHVSKNYLINKKKNNNIR